MIMMVITMMIMITIQCNGDIMDDRMVTLLNLLAPPNNPDTVC